jgi:CxxC motif-containing protein (DUF1111 family)
MRSTLRFRRKVSKHPFHGLAVSGCFLLFGSSLLLSSCSKDDMAIDPVTTAYEADEEYSAGLVGTSFDLSVNAFGEVAKNLSGNANGAFVLGNSFFRSNWVIAPASVTSRDGLGPMLNAISCSGCHSLDGRGQPPRTESERLSDLLIRLSRPGAGAHGGPLADPTYGLQISGQANPGVTAEGDMLVHYTEQPGTYPDGNAYSLRQPTYTWRNLGYGAMPTDIQFSPRVAMQIPGLGLLEAIDAATIEALADPADTDGDGISGRPNYVWDGAASRTTLGRFGWKANQPTIRQQVADAFAGDMGLTTTMHTSEELSAVQISQFHYDLLPNGGVPEVTDSQLDAVAFYCSTLAVPVRRNVKDASVLRGKQLFVQVGCGKCHTPKLTTGSTGGTIPEFANQTIRPYTDLLLHDLGPALADGRPDYQASGQEWRTAPLWGLGMIKTVSGHTTLLHDGRARNAEEAILWHGGEADSARQAFAKLPKTDRDVLLKFLQSL